jgi:predicted Rossmann fold nucleotide-binding protein DprA/Smf involved in DNA uptake
MKLAVIGSRGLKDLVIDPYITEDVTEIVSGGAVGADACAAEYARRNGIALTEFRPEYERYGHAAPIKRNETIVDYADRVLAFWDGKSRGTLSVIRYAEKKGKVCEIVRI